MNLNNYLSQEQIDLLIASLSQYGIRAILALLILFVGKWAAGFFRRALRRGMERSKIDPTLIGFLSNIVFYLMMIAVVIAAVSQIGIATSSFVAMLGAAGLAVGLALQGSLSNFASGVLLILFRPFKVGDFIEAAGVTGTVDEIGILATQMHTPDNKGVTVPNSQVMGSHIINFNAHTTRRLDLKFGIGYGDDISKAKAIIAELIANDARCHKEPAPRIGVLELGDSSVNIIARPWVDASDFWPVHFDLTEGIKNRFDAEGITIPYPQRDVHLHQAN